MNNAKQNLSLFDFCMSSPEEVKEMIDLYDTIANQGEENKNALQRIFNLLESQRYWKNYDDDHGYTDDYIDK